MSTTTAKQLRDHIDPYRKLGLAIAGEQIITSDADADPGKQENSGSELTLAELLNKVRAIIPRRPLSYGESKHYAQKQARLVRELLGSTRPDMNLAWMFRQHDRGGISLDVERVPEYRIGERSGVTSKPLPDSYLININRNEPYIRQRFTLAHEFKHLLDFEDEQTLSARLGSGDAKRQYKQREQICDAFAAELLMPMLAIKRAWYRGYQSLSGLAHLFNVSMEAMRIRLETLGFIGERATDTRIYFRQVSNVDLDEAYEEIGAFDSIHSPDLSLDATSHAGVGFTACTA